MLRCVIGVDVIDVSKDRTASIFRDTQLLRSYFVRISRFAQRCFWVSVSGILSLGKRCPTLR